MLVNVILYVVMELCRYFYIAGGKNSVFGQSDARSTAQFFFVLASIVPTLYRSKMGKLISLVHKMAAASMCNILWQKHVGKILLAHSFDHTRIYAKQALLICFIVHENIELCLVAI